MDEPANKTRHSWVPDRPIRRRELLSAVSAALLAGWTLSRTPLLWEWVAVGFLAVGIAIGPIGGSRAGKRVGAWFRALEMQSRAACIIIAFVAIQSLALVVDIPPDPALNGTVGGAFAIVGYTILHGIYSWRRH